MLSKRGSGPNEAETYPDLFDTFADISKEYG
jgi:hypothetical protein